MVFNNNDVSLKLFVEALKKTDFFKNTVENLYYDNSDLQNSDVVFFIAKDNYEMQEYKKVLEDLMDHPFILADAEIEEVDTRFLKKLE